MLNLDLVFLRKKGQKDVAEFLLKKGIRITSDGRFFFGDVEVSGSAISRALNLDRRVVCAAAAEICASPELMKVFGKLNSTLLLRDVASELGFGAIELVPRDASSTGILAGVTRVIADAGISIRQITTDDPMFKNAEMIVVTERPLPGDIIEKLMRLPGVSRVSVIG